MIFVYFTRTKYILLLMNITFILWRFLFFKHTCNSNILKGYFKINVLSGQYVNSHYKDQCSKNNFFFEMVIPVLVKVGFIYNETSLRGCYHF